MGTSQTGRMGEDAACRFLEGKGHVVLERGWRYSHKEIDIITRYANEIHIVEVKSRTAPVLAAPEVNVNRAKLRNLVSGARGYLRTLGPLPHDLEVFFDVVTVVFGTNGAEVQYFPNAYIPLYVQ